MSCVACQEAEKNAWTAGSYYINCDVCTARQLAHSPAAKDAHLGYPEALQAAMRVVFDTPEKYRLGRIAVYEWGKRINEAKEIIKS